MDITLTQAANRVDSFLTKIREGHLVYVTMTEGVVGTADGQTLTAYDLEKLLAAKRALDGVVEHLPFVADNNHGNGARHIAEAITDKIRAEGVHL